MMRRKIRHATPPIRTFQLVDPPSEIWNFSLQRDLSLFPFNEKDEAMSKTLMTVSAATLAVAAVVAPAQAEAQRGVAAGVAAGLVGGAIVGGAIASQRGY